MLSSYTDLLDRLGFDLTPLVSQGQTWYLCRGKKDDRVPCRRMVPEIYLRTSVGKVLKAADKADLKGDDLVEELATALSYAICSQHHQTVHKVARAIESRQVIEKWREEQSPANTPSNWIKQGSRPSTPSSPTDEDAEGEDFDDYPFVTSEATERLKVERDYQDILRASNRERGGSGSDPASSASSAHGNS